MGAMNQGRRDNERIVVLIQRSLDARHSKTTPGMVSKVRGVKDSVSIKIKFKMNKTNYTSSER